MRALITLFAGLFGLAFGSFLNVCLSRWPDGESIVSPGSHCRTCGRALSWWENVPLVSWLALRGRCRTCKSWIGLRYPLVEAAVALPWAILVWWVSIPFLDSVSALQIQNASGNDSLNIAHYYFHSLLIVGGKLILCWLLVALAALDAEYLWLPDKLTLSGTAIGLFLFLFREKLLDHWGILETSRYGIWEYALQRLLAIFAAAGLILLIRWLYQLIRHREGLGLGDAKLMALLAAWLGLNGALLAFGLGAIFGALAALVLLALPKLRHEGSWAEQKLPLGTFLCVGGIVSALWGQPLIAAYLRWAGF